MGNDRRAEPGTIQTEQRFVVGTPASNPTNESVLGNPNVVVTSSEPLSYSTMTDPVAVSYTSTDGHPVPPTTEQPKNEQNLRAEFNLEDIKDEAGLFEDVTPYYNEMNKLITELRLQSVSTGQIDQNQQQLINRLNELYAPYNIYREDFVRQAEARKQQQFEMQKVAEAQNMVTQIEQRLNGVDINLADTADLKAALEEIASVLHISIDELIKRLPKINATLAAKLLSASQTPAPVTASV